MPKHLEKDLAAVLIAVGQICNKKVKTNRDKPYAIPRTVARMCGFVTKGGLPAGNKAKSILRELEKQGKVECIGTTKLSYRENKSATKFAEAYVTVTNKKYDN